MTHHSDKDVPWCTPVFEHRDFIIINKPAGIGFHFEGEEPGIAELIQSKRGERLWPVHRLDKMTSGLLIFARSANAARQFQSDFSQHQIAKYYIALGTKKPRKKQGEICGDMTKTRNGSWKLLRSQDNPAITRFFSYVLGEGRRLYVLRLYTGKTHQIRVALKSLGAPILGDERYGGDKSDRGYLHAWGVTFKWQGELVQVTTLPEDGDEFQHESLQSRLKQIESPWTLTL